MNFLNLFNAKDVMDCAIPSPLVGEGRVRGAEGRCLSTLTRRCRAALSHRGRGDWVLLLCAISLPGLAHPEAGYTSANFLKIGTGARAAAMADSFTAVADDATALYWNPAGLALLSGTGLSTTHGQWLEGVSQDYLAFSYKLPEAGGFGVGFALQNTSAFNAALEDSLGNYSGIGSSVSASDWALSLAYADSLGRFLPGEVLKNTYAGLKMRILGQNTLNLGDTGIAFEAGFLHAIPSAHLRFGLSLQNIGTSLLQQPQPFLVRFGAAWSNPNSFSAGDRLTFALDTDIHEDTGFRPSLGAEYFTPLTQDLAGALRTGVRSTDDLGGFSAMTFGGGLRKDFGDFAAGLDYAFVPYGAIGATHRFSLNVSLPQKGAPGTVPVTAPVPSAPEKAAPAPVEKPAPAAAMPDKPLAPVSPASAAITPTPLEAGRRAMEEGKLEDALKVFQAVVAKDPSNVKARQLLGNCLIKLGRPDEAQKIFKP